LACRQPLIGLHGAVTVSIALIAPCQGPLVSGVLYFQSSLTPLLLYERLGGTLNFYQRKVA
jgi:hypothetical protein